MRWEISVMPVTSTLATLASNKTIQGGQVRTPQLAVPSVQLNPPFGMCPNRMHDTPSAAACIGLAPATMEVERCRKRLNIKFYRLGRKILYREKELLEFVDSCRVEG
jgi:hypothetical protein